MTEYVSLAIDGVVRFTDKSALIRVATKLTWVPLSQVKVHKDDKNIDVPEWLYNKLEWTPDYENIEYVATAAEIKAMKAKWNKIDGDICW